MNKKIITGLIVVVVLVGIGYYILANKKTPVQTIATPDPTINWQTKTNALFGFSFKYPAPFFAVNQEPKILVGDCNYGVFPQSCPNINNIVIGNQVASGGDVNAIKSNLSYPSYWKNPAGEKSTINNVPYCLYQNEDAAMMHEYNSYYYATVVGKECLVVNLNTSTTNCDVYLPIDGGDTEQQKNYDNCITTNKDQPNILSQIVSTFRFTNK